MGIDRNPIDQGTSAYRDGKTIADNPYRYPDQRAALWNRGWALASAAHSQGLVLRDSERIALSQTSATRGS